MIIKNNMSSMMALHQVNENISQLNNLGLDFTQQIDLLLNSSGSYLQQRIAILYIRTVLSKRTYPDPHLFRNRIL